MREAFSFLPRYIPSSHVNKLTLPRPCLFCESTYAAGPSPLVSEEKWVKYAWLLHHLARLRIPPTFLRPLQQRHGWRTVQASASQESRQEESDLKWNGGDFGQNNYPLAEASSLTFHWSFAKPWVVLFTTTLEGGFCVPKPVPPLRLWRLKTLLYYW